MDRRQFLTWVGVGMLASNIPVVIAACSKSTNGSEPNQSNAGVDTPPRSDGFLEVGSVEEVAQKGQIINKKAKVVVVRNPKDNTLLAINPICPHQGCNAKWKADDKNFVCPCHGSKFSPEGKVLTGPATQSLGTYEVKEEKGLVLVKAVS